MNKDDLASLSAEVIALQAVLMAVFRRMAEQTPELTHLFCGAFDEAEDVLCGIAGKAGLEPALATTTSALTVIEELRRAVLKRPDACSGGG